METKKISSVISLLLIEDNRGDQVLINEYLRESETYNFSLKSCSSIKEGLDLLKTEKFDAVILDLGLPDSSGIDSLISIKEKYDSLPVIVLTIDNSDEMGMEAIKYGAQDYLIKDNLQHINLYKTVKYSISRKNLELQLRDTLNQYERTFEQAAVGIAHISLDATFLKVNKKFSEILGYTKEELIGKTIEFVTCTEDLEKDLVEIESLISGKKRYYNLEKRFIHKNGSLIWANVTRTTIFNEDKEPEYFFTTLEDITSRKILEFELQKQKDLLDKIINTLPVGVWLADSSGNIIRSNKRGEEIWQGSKYVDINNLKEYRGWWAHNGRELTNEDWAIYRAINNKETSLGEIINIQCFDGSKKTILNSAVPLLDDNDNVTGVLVVNEDITKLVETEKKLKALVSEKETLIKESHHRIKNNLQLITSLLKLSLSNVKDMSVKNILTDTLNRIVSISTLHGYLYRSFELNEVNVQTYLYKIIDYIKVSLLADSNHIKIIKDIDNFTIGSELAISLGLMINELITNAVKYAFKDKEEGVVYIELKRVDEKFILKVKDNGIGMEGKIDFKKTDTLGFQILYSLTSQHNGTINYTTSNGTEYFIEIPAA